MTTPSSVINEAIWSTLGSVNTSLPGIIKEYDPTTNKATIQPALNRNYESGPLEMPLLKNVPLLFPSGDGFSITFPVKEGDYVLLIFSARSIDLWKSVGGKVTPDDRRKFHLSDAIAIPGLRPFTADYSKNNGQDFLIVFAGSEIRIQDTGEIQIKTANKVAIGTQTTELLQVLSNLMTYLQGASVTGTSLGGPLSPTFTALVSALQADLETIKGTIT